MTCQNLSFKNLFVNLSLFHIIIMVKNKILHWL